MAGSDRLLPIPQVKWAFLPGGEILLCIRGLDFLLSVELVLIHFLLRTPCIHTGTVRLAISRRHNDYSTQAHL